MHVQLKPFDDGVFARDQQMVMGSCIHIKKVWSTNKAKYGGKFIMNWQKEKKNNQAPLGSFGLWCLCKLVHCGYIYMDSIKPLSSSEAWFNPFELTRLIQSLLSNDMEYSTKANKLHAIEQFGYDPSSRQMSSRRWHEQLSQLNSKICVFKTNVIIKSNTMYHDNTFRDFKCATMVSTSHIPKLLLLFIENKGEARGTLGSWPPFHARVLHPTFSRFCSNLPHQCQVPRAMHVSQQNLFAYTCVCVCV